MDIKKIIIRITTVFIVLVLMTFQCFSVVMALKNDRERTNSLAETIEVAQKTYGNKSEEEIVDDNDKEEKLEVIVEPREDAKYYIKVNYLQNVVNIFADDEEGNFTIPVKVMICSTGVSTPTSGVYRVSDRGEWGMMVGNVWAQYYTRISGVILFHSVPYLSKSNNTLEYWEYDKLGTSASAGCVRLTVEDAKWIFDNCKAGTQVEFYADSNPGPLGKPTARKISEESELLRGWDPTDLDERNPWHNTENI